MAYHDDLLKHAFELADKNPSDPAQPDLRRAVSAAYYALFHLLISEVVALWSHNDSKAALARMPEHMSMMTASNRVQKQQFVGEDPTVVQKLKDVAAAFVRLQDMRQMADYNTQMDWTHTEALREVTRAATTFAAWDSIRLERIAQDYVASLLIKPRRAL